MRVLGSWIMGGVAVALGCAVGHREVGMIALVMALVMSVVGGWRAARASSALAAGRGWWVAAAWLVLLGRGATAAGNDDPMPWPGPRGQAVGLRALAIEGASHPGPRCRVRARSVAGAGPEGAGQGVALWLDAPPEACPLAAGQQIRVRADRLQLHVHPELPGDPLPTGQARSQGAVALASVDRVWWSDGEASAYWGWVARQRQLAWEVTRGDPDASFVVAAGLGVRSALSSDQRTALRRAGLGHLIAVSGLHVGLAAWALLALSLRLGARVGGGTIGVMLSWGPLVAYVLLTGASPPAVRAGIMAVGAGLGGLVGRPHHGPVLLAATSVAMLIVRPAWAFDPGFQLSVAAMATLVRAPAGEGMVRQTWRVTWAVLPLSLWHFGHAGAWGVLCNLVAVPVFTLWVLPLGLLGWWLVPWLGVAALTPAGWGARPILDLAAFVATWPSPPAWAVAGAAAVGLGLGLVVGRRDAHGELHPRWGWLPPGPVALAVVLVVGWPRGPEGPSGRWWAAGSPRAPAVVTVAREGAREGARDGGRAIACVHEVSLSPERWRGLLDAMGLEAAGLVTHGRLEPEWAPHERALQRVLGAQGRWVDDPSGCPEPPPEAEVERALALCRRRAGGRYGMALVDEEGSYCFVGGRWLLDSPSSQGPR